MSDYFHQFVFGIYPYICLAVLLLGSLVRFDREQYTWKSDSSQMLRHGALRLGSSTVAVTCPSARCDSARTETGPKAVGARSTTTRLPSSSQRRDVPKSSRRVSGSPSSSRSRSCTSRCRSIVRKWALPALLGGQ